MLKDGGRAESQNDQLARDGEALHSRLQGLGGGDEVEDRIDSATAGEPLGLGGEVMRRAIDDLIDSEGLGVLQFFG